MAGLHVPHTPQCTSIHGTQIKNEGGRIRPPSQRAIYYSHSMASVLPSRHSSCIQFSVPSRVGCRQVTPCRASSASGTKAGTTLKTFFKLRTLSFCFCPKGRGEPPLEARYRRKRPFRNSTALLPASRQLQSQMIGRGRLPTRFQIRRSGDCAADRERESYQAACPMSRR